jgi:hypothetical protein
MRSESTKDCTMRIRVVDGRPLNSKMVVETRIIPAPKIVSDCAGCQLDLTETTTRTTHQDSRVDVVDPC